uniref:Chromosome 1 open reading frame 94 n=1 Tax=Salvator merianae TaxID=96440 RepID=A0A8D0BZF4_SALMN
RGKRGSRSACDVQLSTKSTVTGILLPAKLIYKNAKSTESGNSNTVGCNTQIAKLLAQFPLKCVEAAKTLDSKTVTEETKLIKDLLQNNVFGAALHKDCSTRPPPIMTMAESPGFGQKKQLPVFAKICSKTESELFENEKEDTNGWVGGWVDWLVRSEVEELQILNINFVFTASSVAIDKNNLKYSGNVFTPRFPTTSSTTGSLKQPMWLSLNYPPPPVFPNHSSFPQYQSLYQPRARIPYQQALHPQLGCYSRQVTPYNPQQIFRSPYTPVLGYIPLVQPGYSYQQRNPTKPSSSVRDPPAMAGDGPQYPFSPSYGFTSGSAGPVRTNPYFSSSGNSNSF